MRLRAGGNLLSGSPLLPGVVHGNLRLRISVWLLLGFRCANLCGLVSLGYCDCGTFLMPTLGWVLAAWRSHGDWDFNLWRGLLANYVDHLLCLIWLWRCGNLIASIFARYINWLISLDTRKHCIRGGDNVLATRDLLAISSVLLNVSVHFHVLAWRILTLFSMILLVLLVDHAVLDVYGAWLHVDNSCGGVLDWRCHIRHISWRLRSSDHCRGLGLHLLDVRCNMGLAAFWSSLAARLILNRCAREHRSRILGFLGYIMGWYTLFISHLKHDLRAR